MRSKIYLSGKMRGLPGCGFKAFDEAARLGRSLGFDIISPAEMDRGDGIEGTEFGPACLEGSGDPFLVREFAERDIEVLLVGLRGEDGDGIALLPGWETSTGAKAELAIAKWVGLRVLDARTFQPLEVELVGREIRPPMPAQFQSCSLGDGLCGLERDLEEQSMIAIAKDFADREVI